MGLTMYCLLVNALFNKTNSSQEVRFIFCLLSNHFLFLNVRIQVANNNNKCYSDLLPG